MNKYDDFKSEINIKIEKERLIILKNKYESEFEIQEENIINYIKLKQEVRKIIECEL